MKSTATGSRPREGGGVTIEEGARTGERAARAELQEPSSRGGGVRGSQMWLRPSAIADGFAMAVMRVSSAGNGAALERDRSPAVAVRERGGQSQHETTHGGDDLDADLEQLESQGGDLGPRPGGAAGGEA